MYFGGKFETPIHLNHLFHQRRHHTHYLLCAKLFISLKSLFRWKMGRALVAKCVGGRRERPVVEGRVEIFFEKLFSKLLPKVVVSGNVLLIFIRSVIDGGEKVFWKILGFVGNLTCCDDTKVKIFYSARGGLIEFASLILLLCNLDYNWSSLDPCLDYLLQHLVSLVHSKVLHNHRNLIVLPQETWVIA